MELNNYCFDCDDTLYDLSWPLWKTMEQFFPDLQLDDKQKREWYKEYRQYGDVVFDLLQKGVITPDDSGILRAAKLCRAHNLHLDILDAWEFQKSYKDNQYKVQMDPEIEAFLKTYPGKTGILTNGQAGHQLAKVHALKADQYVDPRMIYASSTLGYRKPDRECFETYFKKTNENPENWFYIGDSYENDMIGAKTAGLKTIYFNRHQNPSGPAADYEVSSAAELVDLLIRLNKEKQA